MTRYADPTPIVVTPEQRSRHSAANADLIALLSAELVGSGYRPTQWCINRACVQAYPTAALTCPHCGTPNTRHPDAMSGVAL